LDADGTVRVGAGTRLTLGYRRLSALMSTSWYLDALILALVVAGTVVLYGFGTNFVPTGADPGNWLAIANERLGRDVMAADVTYLPLFPGLLAGLLWLWGPIAGFDIAAMLTIAALAAAVYVCTRPVGRGYALVAAVVVAVAGNQVEAYAWGGYPQLLATALGLLATFFLLRYHDTERSGHLWRAVVFVAATVATHALIGGLLVFALVLSTAHWLYLARPPQGRLRAMLTSSSYAAAAAVVIFIASVSVPEGVVPTLNPEETGRFESLLKAVREAPLPWAIVTLAAITVLFRRRQSPAVAATVASGVSWTLAGLAFFLATAEPRGLMVAQVGVVVCAVVTFAAVLGSATATRQTSRNARVAGYRWLIIANVALFCSLVVSGVATYASSTKWYRLVDEAELRAFDRLTAASTSDDLVFASRGRRGMPIGWWTQGYAQRRSYSGHDTAYLAFPDEREQAELANSFFSGVLSDTAALALLESAGADFLAVDRRGPDARWLRSEFAETFTVVDDTSNIVILEVRKGVS
jgi:6-pyruvoyl-tetrahydropterin synthase related domain